MHHSPEVLGGANFCLSHSGLAAGTTTTITTGALVISIRGRTYNIAAGPNAAAPTVDSNTGAAFKPVAAGGASVFVVAYTAAGTRQVFQGVGNAGNNNAFAAGDDALEFPLLPITACAVGWIVVQAGPTATGNFVFGVNNLSGVTGITYTFVPASHLPARPYAA